ncbi:MAG: aldo/keto reductase [Oscillospiraceae bacterium]|nr:aldo/keto reductase [Oscillospiraceae bacterium]
MTREEILKLPKLGFGLMRLPKEGDVIDIEQTKKMVDLFLAKGFTYFDTAWAYAGSEDAIRQALVERYPRESFQLATKNAAWINCKTKEEAYAQFETSLKQTGAGYFDFYLLHNLGDSRTHVFDDFGMWDFVKDLKAQGKIKHLGFSMHDKAEALDKVLTAHPEVDFVQLQINYADWESPTVESRKCYETACKHNVPVIVMEPVKGGTLINIPESVKAVFSAYDEKVSLASWAIRFAASLENVAVVLSGMSNLEQMEENLSFMENFTPMTAEEQAVVKKAQEAFAALPMIPCTACQYCTKGCPQNVPIPKIFEACNVKLIYGNDTAAKGSYNFATRDGVKASDCIECGLCEEACPQHIAIREKFK